MNAKSHIQSYSLFGETSELEDELHVESIRARSKRHNWELKPHRHARLHQLLFLTGGGGKVELDGRSLALPPPCIVNVPRGVVHGFQFAPGTVGTVVTLTSHLLDHCLTGSDRLRAALSNAVVLPQPPNLHSLTKGIEEEYHVPGFGRTEVLRGLAGAILARVARCIDQTLGDGKKGQSNPLFARFEMLLERDFRLRRSLADYAAELAVSPTHLNRIVQRSTGHSASQLVNDRVLREARRLLIYTNLTAAEVAYDLGFSDPAHFSRVFTNGTGVAPGIFRRQIEAGATAPKQTVTQSNSNPTRGET